MGTKTSVKLALEFSDFCSEQRIPIHGDENTPTLNALSIGLSQVKKESPYMGTKT